MKRKLLFNLTAILCIWCFTPKNLFAQENGTPNLHDEEFVFVDAETNQEIVTLKSGDHFNQNTHTFITKPELSIAVSSEVSDIGSVVMIVRGPINYSRTENVSPYSLFGDSNGNFKGRAFPEGTYKVTAIPFSLPGGFNGGGVQGTPKTIMLTIGDRENIHLDNFFTLIDATNDSPIASIGNGFNIDSGTIDTSNVSIEVSSPQSGSIGSMYLQLEGPVNHIQTENHAPFTLFGDKNGNYFGRNLPEGDYKLTVIPFSGYGLSQTPGYTTTYFFSIAPPDGNLTYVPDDNFEQELINLGYDDALDDFVLTENLLTIEQIYLENIEIFIGLEDLKNLTDFTCYSCNVDNYTPSVNPLLTNLFLENSTGIKGVNFSNCPNLEKVKLDDWYNETPMPDFAPLTSLKKLILQAFYSNPNASTLDLSTNHELEKLELFAIYNLNKVTFSSTAPVKTIGIADMPLLSNLDFAYDIKDRLENIAIGYSPVTQINLSEFTNLKFVNVFDNSFLERINLNNGNNVALETTYFNRNPVLNCIQVDDVDFALSAPGWHEDDPSVYSTDCGDTPPEVNSGIANEQYTLYPNPANEEITITDSNNSIEKVEIVNVYGNTVKTIRASSSESVHYIDVSTLKKGVYFINLRSGDQITTRKVLID